MTTKCYLLRERNGAGHQILRVDFPGVYDPGKVRDHASAG